MLSDYRRVEEEEILTLERAVAEQQAKVEGQDDARTRLERKVKMAFGKWRVDYQGHMREKYQPLVREIKQLHGKYTEVLRQREQEEVEREDAEVQKAKVAKMRARLHEEEQERLKQEARERLEEEERRLMEGHANTRRLDEAKEKIKQLWDALEVDPGERHAFYKKVLGQNTNMEVVKLCQVECGRQGRRLPVVQLITKVEAKQGQLEGLRREIKAAAMAGTSPAQMRGQDVERERLTGELAQLQEGLRVALDEYEAEMGQPLHYQGNRYTLNKPNNNNRSPSKGSQGNKKSPKGELVQYDSQTGRRTPRGSPSTWK